MRQTLAALLLLAAGPATAEPKVVTDIAPVHSLVAAVMGELGQPDVLLDAAADPHHITLRPSQARALAGADAVFWIGPALTPWLARSLASRPETIALTEFPGTALITGHDDHGDSDHGHFDPHAWLDPANAELWLRVIGETLGRIDPQNAATYAANAQKAAADLQALSAELTADLAPLAGNRYLVAHDAYAYFAGHFGLNLSEAISDSDAEAASAARLAELRDSLAAQPVTCAFHEPQQSPAGLETLLAGTATPQATLDPLGSALAPGPALYPDLLRAMADSIAHCAD